MKGSRPIQGELTLNNNLDKTPETEATVSATVDGLNDHDIEGMQRFFSDTPGVPVYAGMAGPTDIVSLMRYARLCGVSTSLRALQNLGIKAAKLVMHTDPTEQLQLIAHHCATHTANNIIGIHLFSFGGFPGSAQWMHDVIGAAVPGEQVSDAHSQP